MNRCASLFGIYFLVFIGCFKPSCFLAGLGKEDSWIGGKDTGVGEKDTGKGKNHAGALLLDNWSYTPYH